MNLVDTVVAFADARSLLDHREDVNVSCYLVLGPKPRIEKVDGKLRMPIGDALRGVLAAQRPNCLYDSPKYVLGPVSSTALFWKLVTDTFSNAGDTKALAAVAASRPLISAALAKMHAEADSHGTGFVAIKIDGDAGPASDRPLVSAYLGGKFVASFNTLAPAPVTAGSSQRVQWSGTCLVTGQTSVIPANYSQAQGVVGGRPAGASIMTWNGPAWDYLGRDGTHHYPIGVRADYSFRAGYRYITERAGRYPMRFGVNVGAASGQMVRSKSDWQSDKYSLLWVCDTADLTHVADVLNRSTIFWVDRGGNKDPRTPKERNADDVRVADGLAAAWSAVSASAESGDDTPVKLFCVRGSVGRFGVVDSCHTTVSGIARSLLAIRKSFNDADISIGDAIRNFAYRGYTGDGPCALSDKDRMSIFMSAVTGRRLFPVIASKFFNHLHVKPTANYSDLVGWMSVLEANR